MGDIINVDENETNAFSDRKPNFDESWFEVNLNENPMPNDLVLGSVFKYMDCDDLKVCRLVCKKWNILTIPFTRSLFQIKIRPCNTYSFLGDKGIGGLRNLVELIESNTLGIPYGKYWLGSFDTTRGPGQKFLELCGNNSKEFCLDRSAIHMVEDVSALFRSSPKLESFVMPLDMKSKKGDGVVVKLFPGKPPKLTFLKLLDASNDYPVKRRNTCPTFYEELLGVAENISTLCLPTWFSDNVGQEWIDISLEILECIERLGMETKIKKISIVDMNSKRFKLLEQMVLKKNGLKLEELNLTVTREVDNFEWFEIAKLFKNSLIYLSVKCMVNGPASLTFPCMPNLKTLKLELTESCTALSCENENFGTTFPVLENFCISSSPGARSVVNNFLTFDGCRSLSMKSLILRRNINIEMGSLNRILSSFPTLTFLECKVISKKSAEVIQKIWTHMTQLEGLKIYGNLAKEQNVDSLVTGIPSHEFQKMSDLFESFGTVDTVTAEDRREKILTWKNMFAEVPSIRNLTNLRFLSIRLVANKNKQGSQKSRYLTDLTGYFGLYSLKNLRHLSIYDSEMSRTCSEILVHDKELISWAFKSHVSNNEIIPSNWKPNNLIHYN